MTRPSFTIRIPKSLESTFEAYKDRFNVSEVCQQAIISEVSYQKLLDGARTDAGKLIARLKKEKRAAQNHAYQLGKKTSVGDLENLSYEEIKVIHAGLLHCWEVEHLEKVLISLDSDFQEHIPDASRIIMQLTELADEHSVDDKAFIRGWMSGISDQWRKLKDEVEAVEDEEEF